MKKLLSVILVLTLLCGIAPCFSVSAQETDVISSGQITVANGGETVDFSFTAPKTDNYYFYSNSDGVDPIVDGLYTAGTGKLVQGGMYFDNAVGYDFSYYARLEKGVSYRLSCGIWNNLTGSYKVYVGYNPAKSLTYTPVKAKKFKEFTHGGFYGSDEKNSQEYLYFDRDWNNEYAMFAAGDKVTAIMRDGSKKEYICSFDYSSGSNRPLFRTKTGESLGVWRSRDNQKDSSGTWHPWRVGMHSFTFSAHGYNVDVPIEIAAKGWEKRNGKWYYSKDGADVRGWISDSGKWYFMDKADGSMETGWLKDGGKWYLLDSSGAMKTGWQKISDKWYYFNTSGVMLTGWEKIGGKWYYFNTSGIMQTGWQKINNVWYYMDSSGAMLTGWQKIGSDWYYFESSGAMAADKWVGDYYLLSNGKMATNQWIGSYYVGADGKWVKGKTK